MWVDNMYDNNYLTHFGIKGMRWGVRRFQNEDGSLTRAGRRNEKKQLKKGLHKLNKSKKKSWLTPNPDGRADNMHRQRRIVNRAARYVMKRNMTPTQALEASRAAGRRNVAILMATMAGLSAASIAATLSGNK
jgi:hypothetical protein